MLVAVVAVRLVRLEKPQERAALGVAATAQQEALQPQELLT
jgi:hypothetical protein